MISTADMLRGHCFSAPPGSKSVHHLVAKCLRRLLTCTPQEKIDFLFLDGLPREYLHYLKAAEPRLAPGATIVADNAGVFAQVTSSLQVGILR